MRADKIKTIPVKGNIIRSEQVSNDMYVSIDLVEEVIERQLRKYKTKIIGKHKDGGNLRKEFIEKENEGEEEEVKIIRTKQFGMKPMFPEDACVQMELLGHSFFVFRNADTDEVNVVYKRKGNIDMEKYYRMVIDLYKEVLLINRVNPDRVLDVQREISNAITTAIITNESTGELELLKFDIENLKSHISQ